MEMRAFSQETRYQMVVTPAARNWGAGYVGTAGFATQVGLITLGTCPGVWWQTFSESLLDPGSSTSRGIPSQKSLKATYIAKQNEIAENNKL
jgi:hypothetical protein